MGYRELIESIQREAEEKIRTIWHEAEAQTKTLKSGSEEQLKLMRERYTEMQSSAVKKQVEGILSEAKNKGRIIRLSTEASLSKRLYSTALSSLGILRNERYKDVFRTLAAELPSFKWQTVKVNPEDKELAKECFPDAKIIPDTAITGGMEVAAEDGEIKIINTFKKRLENGWTEIVPALIMDVYKELEKQGATPKP
jgi:vacuolar-type H+-ATPase subunit E/Vma4